LWPFLKWALGFVYRRSRTHGRYAGGYNKIDDDFADSLKVESIEPTGRFEVQPDLKDITFSQRGPKGVLCGGARS
jgi:hypothetical protein